jgi:hypothetical protein
VKNYYVRQQCSRCIKRGYDIVTSLCPQSLAAVSSGRDTLVLVVLNEGAKAVHRIDLSLFGDLPNRSNIKAYRTSASGSLSNALSSVVIGSADDTGHPLLTLTVPAQSITTMVIPIVSEAVTPEQLICDGADYLIIPRLETGRALTATGSKVTIQDIDYGEAQRWHLTDAGSGTFSLQNGLGLRLTAHRASGSSSLTAQTATAAEQNFYIDEADYPFFKILASRGHSHGLDLNNVSTANGTAVNIWQYQDGTLPVHRQWLLLPLNASQIDTGIKEMKSEEIANRKAASGNCYDLQGRRLTRPMKGINIVNGRKVVIR